MESLKEKLNKEIQNFEDVSKSMNDTNANITECKEDFEKCLKYRKMSNLNQFINLLDQEESDLRQKFDEICIKHQNESLDDETLDELRELARFSDLKLALLKSEIMETLEEEQSPTHRPSHVVNFSEGTYLSFHPLGKLEAKEKRVKITDDVPSIQFNAPESKQDGMLNELSKKLDDYVRIVKMTSRIDGVTVKASNSKVNIGRQTVLKRKESKGNISKPDVVAVTKSTAGGKTKPDLVSQTNDTTKTVKIDSVAKPGRKDSVAKLGKSDSLSWIKSRKQSVEGGSISKRKESMTGTKPDVIPALKKVSSAPTAKQQDDLDSETLVAMKDYKKMADGKKFEFFGTLMKMKNDKLCNHLITENPSAIQRKNTHDSTLLHFAAASDRVAVVKHLIKYGADINAVNNAGYSLLHFAAYNNAEAVIKYLCQNYPQLVELKSNKKLTPFDFSTTFNCTGALKAFKEVLSVKDRKKSVGCL